MFKSLTTVVAVLLAVTAFCEAACRFTDRIKPVNVKFDELANKRLNVVYAAGKYITIVDHAYIDLKKSGVNIYNGTSTIVKKDGTMLLKHYKIEYKDGVMQETYYINDVLYKKLWSATYILAKTDEGAMLFYRCSDSDAVYDEGDLRYITVPDGTILSDKSMNQLMSVGKQFDFDGSLFKLPNRL